MSAAATLIVAPPPRRVRLALVPPPPPPQYIGLGRCAAEGWRVARYPASRAYLFAGGPWKASVERQRRRHAADLQELRRAGAIVVACQQVHHRRGTYVGRIWWFGGPPAEWTGDLRALARAAGMLYETPATFRWFGRRGRDL